MITLFCPRCNADTAVVQRLACSTPTYFTQCSQCFHSTKDFSTREQAEQAWENQPTTEQALREIYT